LLSYEKKTNKKHLYILICQFFISLDY
jgi:hypothetical protein